MTPSEETIWRELQSVIAVHNRLKGWAKGGQTQGRRNVEDGSAFRFGHKYGHVNGVQTYKDKIGIHAPGRASQGGTETYKRKTGIFGFTAEQKLARGRKSVQNWPPWALALGRHRHLHVHNRFKKLKPCLFCDVGEENAKRIFEKEAEWPSN
jgi:hypothetical protein